MTRKNSIASLEEVKGLLSADQDILQEMVRRILQDMLEAEMGEALQAAKSERNGKRLGYRSGYLGESASVNIGPQHDSSITIQQWLEVLKILKGLACLI